MLDVKKLLAKILSFFKLVRIDTGDQKIYPTNTGWTPTYVSMPDLDKYNMIYIRACVKGTVTIMTFPRFDNIDSFSQYFDDTYQSGSSWYFTRLIVRVDWKNNRVGTSLLNGNLSDQDTYIWGVWGTNKLG